MDGSFLAFLGTIGPVELLPAALLAELGRLEPVWILGAVAGAVRRLAPVKLGRRLSSQRKLSRIFLGHPDGVVLRFLAHFVGSRLSELAGYLPWR